jgi:Tol biopolymer transport system component
MRAKVIVTLTLLCTVLSGFACGGGGEEETATPTPGPAQNKIAFSSFRDGDYEIYVMDADGSNLTRLTNHQAQDKHPAWSP